jgi:glutamyl-tRNA synthetase
MAERARFYFIEDVEPDAEARRRHLGPEARELLRELRGALQALSIWDREGIEAAFGEVRERRGVKLGELAQPARVAVTGSAASPGIFETLELLGRERTLSRIDRAARDGEAPASAGEGGPRK